MLFSICFVAMALPFLSVVPVAAAQFDIEPNLSQPGIVQFPFKAMNISEVDTTNFLPNIKKRQTQIDTTRWGPSFKRHVIEVLIGTPPQKVLVEPDLGSHLFWVPTKANPSRHNALFDLDKSSTKKDLDKSDGIQYAGEKVEFQVYEDEMSFSPGAQNPGFFK